MSQAVPLDELADRMRDYGFAFLVTVSADSRPHLVATAVSWDGDDEALVAPAGRSSRDNVALHGEATLCFPPSRPDDFSLIVDARASVRGDDLVLHPTTAVLHRPAPAVSPR